MTIIAFYAVENHLDWQRDEFDCFEDDMAFKMLWEESEEIEARFYNMDTKSYSDKLMQYGIMNADEFETDYNDELLDNGGWWCRVLRVSEDFVMSVISN